MIANVDAITNSKIIFHITSDCTTFLMSFVINYGLGWGFGLDSVGEPRVKDPVIAQ